MATQTSGYVYIATSKDLATSYVGVSASLLDMDWIPKFGVDNLVWFQGYSDMALADARAETLRGMSDDDRRRLVLKSNPRQADLSPSIWGSDNDEV